MSDPRAAPYLLDTHVWIWLMAGEEPLRSSPALAALQAATEPADRIIAATARALGATLVTRDRRLLDYAAAGHVAALAV
jgi:PIN domain nuclease of toxin-antitoxin system